MKDPAATAALYIVFALLVIGAVVALGIVVLPIVIVVLIGIGIYKFSNRPPPQVSLNDLYSSAIHQLKLFPDYSTFLRAFTKQVISPLSDSAPPTAVCTEIVAVAARLYDLEEFSNVPPPPVSAGDVERALYRETTIAALQKANAVQTFADLIDQSFNSLLANIPPFARSHLSQSLKESEHDTPTMPLCDLFSDKRIIRDLIRPYLSEKAKKLGMFEPLRFVLEENIYAASNIPLDKRPTDRGLVMPEDYKGSFREAVDAYLGNTPLIDVFDAPVPFVFADEIRYSGHWIIAPPGRGKTTLLHTMVMDDLRKDASVILMDSKGDLVEPFRDLKSIADRLIIIDPDVHNPIGVNPLDVPTNDVSHAIDLLEYVFSSLLESKLTSLQQTLFRSVLRALVTAFPNPTLETFRDILTNGYQPYIEYINRLPPDLKDFFLKDFNSKIYEDRKKEIIWRLRLLLENENIRAMLLALRTRFQIGAAMDAGKVVIINNSKSRLGDQGSEFFGRFFIAQVLAAAQQRAGRRPENKKPCFFYIDECQTVIARDEKIPTILDECRSQKIALILAHQRTTQITSDNVLDALSNCAIRYTNSDDEARALAPKLRTTPDVLQSLKRGTFAAFVRDMTPHAIVFTCHKTDFTKHAKITAEERASMAARMKDQYGAVAAAQRPDQPAPAPPPAATSAAQTKTPSPRKEHRAPSEADSKPQLPDSFEPPSDWAAKW